ncbi:MAG TPA: efflux RND transporter permease subunit, partial [Arenibaculum sp.]|nr:efflux RND transporter permease subunit [Arenibaculum sp.]
MNAIINAALSRSRMVLTSLLLLLAAGVFAYVDIPKESDPDINIPIIYTSVHYEGISPEDAERLLIRPIEKEVRSIEGVKEMRATAYQGGANVILEFEAGFDADQALDDVRTQVDLARPELPAEADEPVVSEVNLSLFPVVVVTLSGDVPERTLLRLARDLQDRIQALGPVLEADIAGDREELVEVVIDPLVADSYGIDANQLVQFFARSNRLVAAGNLDTGSGRFAIKVPGLIEDVRDIWDMPVKVDGDAIVRVRDISEIRRTFKDAETFARVDGERAVALEVVKRTGENIIDTIEQVRRAVEAERRFWPAEVQVTYSQDRSTDIRTMLLDLQNNVISAILLVMVVCIGALGIRSGLLVGIAIPGSFLTGILVVYLLGLTINVVVLFSLILAVGMLVDGAIVVTEFADRKMAEGLNRRTAYGLASKRMAWPIIASTLTTLAAFLPLLFWPGVVGEFMKFLPITLLATLTASLLMALIFLPTLGAYFGGPGAATPETMKAIAGGEDGNLRELRGPVGLYVRILDMALRHPLKVVLATFAVLIGVQTYYATHGNGFEFFPDIEPDSALVLVHARGNLSTLEKDALVREVEDRILELDEFDSVYTRVGRLEGGGMGQDQAEDVVGQITMEFRDWTERRPADVILADIRERTASLAGIEVETRKQEGGPPTGKPVAVELTTREPALLPEAVAHVRRGMREIGGLVDIEDNRPLPGIEWKLDV